MQTIFFIAFFIVIGVFFSRLARLVGFKIFKFSEIYNFFLKLLRRKENK
ncbi:MAG: hypothetical protein K0Q49_2601 [Haloplasmataceae bacterium]|jgi:hypothetical protein|nr:hypothetical protein [Haloplasmataceae bacterium]